MCWQDRNNRQVLKYEILKEKLPLDPWKSINAYGGEVFIILDARRHIFEILGMSRKVRNVTTNGMNLGSAEMMELLVARAKIDTYLRFIENLNILTSSSGQKYAVFFQPVPGISKPLTEQEKKYLAPKEFYDLYQEVVSKASHLNAPVYSLLDVFKGVTDEIYSDSIHSHIDEKTGTCLGYQLIIDRIIETLKSQWSLTSFENDKIGN